MAQRRISRRDFLKAGAALSGVLLGTAIYRPFSPFGEHTWPLMTKKDESLLTFTEKAETTYARLKAEFALKGASQFREYIHPRSGDPTEATLWPYTGVVAALNALASLPGKKSSYEADLRETLSGFAAYYDPKSRPPGYDCVSLAQGGGQKYYDDNEWVGLEFIRAYQQLGETQYLNKAEEALRFALSGWTSEQGGGIYWREWDDASKHTCSNGPAAVLALQLYQATENQEYLDWGMHILEWLKGLKAPDSGVYWDNRRKSGDIDRQTFTYNTGTVLHAYSLLYEISAEMVYLEEARGLARDSYAHFARIRGASSVRLYPATPWFNAVLLRGYRALAKVDPEADQTYLEAMRTHLAYAWEHSRGEDGLFCKDAVGDERNNPRRWILDQAGLTEAFALAEYSLLAEAQQ